MRPHSQLEHGVPTLVTSQRTLRSWHLRHAFKDRRALGAACVAAVVKVDMAANIALDAAAPW
jgi:hypothetical protein